MSKQTRQFELRPMVRFKLTNRIFEFEVLRAILEIENDHGSVLGLPGHPTTWGWGPREDLARIMKFPELTKSLSRKIRRAFLWLESIRILRHQDVNEPGQKNGATRFLLAFWVFRIVSDLAAPMARVFSKAVLEVSRTVATWKPPDGWKIPAGLVKSSPLVARVVG